MVIVADVFAEVGEGDEAVVAVPPQSHVQHPICQILSDQLLGETKQHRAQPPPVGSAIDFGLVVPEHFKFLVNQLANPGLVLPPHLHPVP